MLIHGTFMHILPSILKRGRFSPGLITSVTMFLPLCICTMMTAEVNARVLMTAFAVGVSLPAGYANHLFRAQK